MSDCVQCLSSSCLSSAWAVCELGHWAPQGSVAVWATGDWQDSVCPCCGQPHWRLLHPRHRLWTGAEIRWRGKAAAQTPGWKLGVWIPVILNSGTEKALAKPPPHTHPLFFFFKDLKTFLLHKSLTIDCLSLGILNCWGGLVPLGLQIRKFPFLMAFCRLTCLWWISITFWHDSWVVVFDSTSKNKRGDDNRNLFHCFFFLSKRK